MYVYYIYPYLHSHKNRSLINVPFLNLSKNTRLVPSYRQCRNRLCLSLAFSALKFGKWREETALHICIMHALPLLLQRQWTESPAQKKGKMFFQRKMTFWIARKWREGEGKISVGENQRGVPHLGKIFEFLGNYEIVLPCDNGSTVELLVDGEGCASVWIGITGITTDWSTCGRRTVFWRGSSRRGNGEEEGWPRERGSSSSDTSTTSIITSSSSTDERGNMLKSDLLR